MKKKEGYDEMKTWWIEEAMSRSKRAHQSPDSGRGP